MPQYPERKSLVALLLCQTDASMHQYVARRRLVPKARCYLLMELSKLLFIEMYYIVLPVLVLLFL